jgi:LmbE family N-acetylglucosaminyl deacetylase
VRVLAIGAHPDDCEIGAGATLAKHAAAGDEVHILALGPGVGARTSGFADAEAVRRREDMAQAAGIALGVTGSWGAEHPDQQYDTCSLLGIIQYIESAAGLVGSWPDVVYTHHEGDLNLDHAITARAVKTAFRPKPGVKAPRILAFEVLSSTELGAPFIPNVFVDVDGEPMAKKLKALEAYGDEIPPAPHPRSLEAVKHLAGLRGASVGLRQAESFMLIREVL